MEKTEMSKEEMKMTLQQLIDAGLSNDQANAILKIYKDSIDGNFIPKERFNQVNDELKTQKQLIADRDKQLEDIKKSAKDAEELQTQISKLQEENAATAKKYAEESLLANKKAALKIQLLADEQGRPHNVDLTSGLFDLTKIEVDESGNIKSGYKEQAEKVRKENAFMFQTKETTQTTAPQTNPWWKPVGTPPTEGAPATATPQEQSKSFGAALAQRKNQMAGVVPVTAPQAPATNIK